MGLSYSCYPINYYIILLPLLLRYCTIAILYPHVITAHCQMHHHAYREDSNIDRMTM